MRDKKHIINVQFGDTTLREGLDTLGVDVYFDRRIKIVLLPEGYPVPSR
jgi:hypothetical protein